MEIEYSLQAQEDLFYWKKRNDIIVLKKIKSLIVSISETPFLGLGKPEPLKYQYSGYWSRRINLEHRLIYEVGEKKVIIHSLKGHY